MQPCRKRIGNVPSLNYSEMLVENWREKERRQQMGIAIFLLGNIQQVITGIAFKLVVALGSLNWRRFQKNPVN
jgi:hypothetical protein